MWLTLDEAITHVSDGGEVAAWLQQGFDHAVYVGVLGRAGATTDLPGGLQPFGPPRLEGILLRRGWTQAQQQELVVGAGREERIRLELTTVDPVTDTGPATAQVVFHYSDGQDRTRWDSAFTESPHGLGSPDGTLLRLTASLGRDGLYPLDPVLEEPARNPIRIQVEPPPP